MFATFFGGETVVFFGDVDHGAVFGDDLNAFEVVALTDFEIVEIVRWGDFDGAGAVGGVGVFVGDNRDFAVGQG